MIINRENRQEVNLTLIDRNGELGIVSPYFKSVLLLKEYNDTCEIDILDNWVIKIEPK